MTAVDNDDRAILCPACGFDLRATAADRCGECGLAIDRAALRVSGIPWASRQRIGRLRAYSKTWWQITRDGPSLRYETAKPQDVTDGRAFRRVTGVLVSLALLAVFAAAVITEGGWASLAIQPDVPLGRAPAAMGPLLDFAVPWSAGATFPPVMPLCLILLAFHLTGVQRFAFRTPAAPAAHQGRAIALSYYTTAPLALLLPAITCYALNMALEPNTGATAGAGPFPRLTIALAGIGGVVFLLAAFGTLYRIAQWVMRTRNCGAPTAALAVAEVLALWLLGGVVLIGLVPWCIGFLWIALDSLR